MRASPTPPVDEALAEVGVGDGLARGDVARLLTLETASPASIVSCITRARERGGRLRDVVSTEMWEALNSFYLSLSRYDLQQALVTGPYSLYQEVKERCALFWGLVDRTMLRDEGRAFLEAGGRIEEADMVLRMLRVALGDELLVEDGSDTGYEGEALALLHAVGGFQAYRRAARRSPSLGRSPVSCSMRSVIRAPSRPRSARSTMPCPRRTPSPDRRRRCSGSGS